MSLDDNLSSSFQQCWSNVQVRNKCVKCESLLTVKTCRKILLEKSFTFLKYF